MSGIDKMKAKIKKKMTLDDLPSPELGNVSVHKPAHSEVQPYVHTTMHTAVQADVQQPVHTASYFEEGVEQQSGFTAIPQYSKPVAQQTAFDKSTQQQQMTTVKQHVVNTASQHAVQQNEYTEIPQYSIPLIQQTSPTRNSSLQQTIEAAKQQTVNTALQQAEETLKHQTGNAVTQKNRKPLTQQTATNESVESQQSFQAATQYAVNTATQHATQQNSNTLKQQPKTMHPKKMTMYLTEELYKAFNDIYAQRMIEGRKTEKSELICEAVRLLVEREMMNKHFQNNENTVSGIYNKTAIIQTDLDS